MLECALAFRRFSGFRSSDPRESQRVLKIKKYHGEKSASLIGNPNSRTTLETVLWLDKVCVFFILGVFSFSFLFSDFQEIVHSLATGLSLFILASQKDGYAS